MVSFVNSVSMLEDVDVDYEVVFFNEALLKLFDADDIETDVLDKKRIINPQLGRVLSLKNTIQDRRYSNLLLSQNHKIIKKP